MDQKGWRASDSWAWPEMVLMDMVIARVRMVKVSKRNRRKPLLCCLANGITTSKKTWVRLCETTFEEILL